jgi:hypothetical protein
MDGCIDRWIDGWIYGLIDGWIAQRQTLNTTNDTRQIKPAKRRVYGTKPQNELENNRKQLKKYLIIN